ncbi:hypothetical protein AHAS_Ahas18G0190600 [Arachis hypogaea]
MTRNRDKEPLLTPDPEPEKTLRRHLQQAKTQHSGRDLLENFEQEKGDMAERGREARKVLGGFNPDFYGENINVSPIRARSFDIKPTTYYISVAEVSISRTSTGRPQ